MNSVKHHSVLASDILKPNDYRLNYLTHLNLYKCKVGWIVELVALVENGPQSFKWENRSMHVDIDHDLDPRTVALKSLNMTSADILFKDVL